MGQIVINPGKLNSYSLEIENQKILLNLSTDLFEASYKISSDTRNPDLNKIYNDLNEELNFVKENNNAIFKITEYLERYYIYVTFHNGKLEQYTAHKL